MVRSPAVRQAQLVDTDTESDPKEAPSEAQKLQPLGSRVPLMSEEFEASEPSGTRTVSSHSLVSSDSTAPLSPDHPLTHVSPTPTPTRRYRSSYETSSSSSSLTFPVRKRYIGTSDLILDTDSEGDKLGDEDTKEDEEDKSLDTDDERERERDREEEAALKGHAFESTEEIAPNPEDDRVYTDIPAYAPPTVPIQTPLSPEWSFGSLPISPSSPVVPSPIALPVATPTTTISRLDALPPTLFLNIDKEVMELYTRLGAVRDEIFSQRYRFRILEWEQERATVTFGALWRPVLALEAWAGRRELQEMRGHVAALEQERGHREK
ncbi:hypothetical protein Tco_0016193 [Tanacetum coccineum]